MIPTNTGSALIVILGALGDLSRRKLVPALYQLSSNGALGEQHVVLGADLGQEMDDHAFRQAVRAMLNESGLPAGDEGAAQWCERCLFYGAVDGRGESYARLAARIEDLERKHQLPGNRVFYLAVPPATVSNVITGMGRAGLNKNSAWVRIVLEKPFGSDLASARKLN